MYGSLQLRLNASMDRQLQGTRSLALAVAIAVFLALVEAFDTDRLGLGARTCFWVGLTAVAFAVRRHLWRLAARTASPSNSLGWRALSALSVTLVMTPVVWLANSAVFEASLSGAELLALVPSVAAVSAGFELLFLIGPVTGRRTRVAAVSDELPKGTFQQRLPLPLRSSEIEALKAEDHYLRVYTSRGSTLLRMRLSDAVAELGTHSGLRTHRSWWVAESAIKGTLHQQGKVRLLTNCGVEVPVSRSATRSIGNMAFAAVEQRAAHD